MSRLICRNLRTYCCAPVKNFTKEEIIFMKSQGLGDDEIKHIQNEFDPTPNETMVSRHIKIGDIVKKTKGPKYKSK